MKEGDVGSYFVDKDGEVWLMISYTDQPQAQFERVRDEKRVQHVIGCPNMEEHGFKKLVPEAER